MIVLMILIFLIIIFSLPFTYALIIRPDKKILNKNYFPKISIIVPAHNEEKNIKRKIKELLSINYPKNNFEIIVVDDFSNDNTKKICKLFFNRIKYIKLSKKSGKIGAINRGLSNASNDIIVITDADTKLNSNSIKKLVRNFINSDIGAVNGTLKISKRKDWISQIEDSYVKQMNKFLFSASNKKSVIFLYGQLCAFRKSIIKKIRTDAAVDDIEIALKVLNKGRGVIQEPTAIVYEEAPLNLNQLLRNKIRRTVCSIEVMLKYLGLLNPKRGLVSITLLTYRIIPLLSPLLLFSIIILSIIILNYVILYAILFFIFIFILLKPKFSIHFLIMQIIVIISWFAFFFKRIPIGASWKNK